MLPFKGLIFDISERKLSPEVPRQIFGNSTKVAHRYGTAGKDAKPSLSEKSLRHIKTISRSAKLMGDLING